MRPQRPRWAQVPVSGFQLGGTGWPCQRSTCIWSTSVPAGWTDTGGGAAHVGSRLDQ